MARSRHPPLGFVITRLIKARWITGDAPAADEGSGRVIHMDYDD
jgi:hypothetical protein